MDKVTQLLELKRLFDNGLLTEDEFIKAKKKLISNQNIGEADLILSTDDNGHGKLTEISSQVENEYADSHLTNNGGPDNEINTVKTSPSYWRYILAIVFFISGGYYIAYKLYFQEKWENEYNVESQQDMNNGQPNSQPSQEEKVSMDFIGQKYVNKTKDSFGGTTEQFSFSPNGKGEFYVAFTVVSSFYELDGPLTWKIDGDKIHVEYTYIASDGVSSREKELLIYNEQRNVFLDYNDNTKVYKSISSKSGNYQETNGYNESSENDDYYNRQQEQAEYESSQAYYNSDEYQVSEGKKKPETNIFLTPGDKIYYGDGTKKNWVEMDENERITIYMETERAYEGNAFSKGKYIVKNGKIKMSWLFTDYEISEGALVVIDDGKRTVLNRMK